MLLNCLLLIQDEIVEDEVKVQNSSSSDKSSSNSTKQGRYRKRASIDHSSGEAASAAKRKNKPGSRGSQKVAGEKIIRYRINWWKFTIMINVMLR